MVKSKPFPLKVEVAVRKHLREAHSSYWETFLSNGFYKATWVLIPFRVFRPRFVFFRG
jgi:hypothetical protein